MHTRKNPLSIPPLFTHLLRPGVLEDGRPRHEEVRPGLRDLLDVGHAHAAVHLVISGVVG